MTWVRFRVAWCSSSPFRWRCAFSVSVPSSSFGKFAQTEEAFDNDLFPAHTRTVCVRPAVPNVFERLQRCTDVNRSILLRNVRRRVRCVWHVKLRDNSTPSHTSPRCSVERVCRSVPPDAIKGKQITRYRFYVILNEHKYKCYSLLARGKLSGCCTRKRIR